MRKHPLADKEVIATVMSRMVEIANRIRVLLKKNDRIVMSFCVAGADRVIIAFGSE